MKKISIIFLFLGVIAWFFFGSSMYVTLTGDGLGGGYGAMFIAFPLIFIGIIVFVDSLLKKKN